ncbi:hypothetical protein B484DRAFT_443433 [Ochromonadaceae sp. CCMP2298]|nr:hypothetical protein B484DRAFT_443433 [Ochromonadaceae sp. CCMP2298]
MSAGHNKDAELYITIVSTSASFVVLLSFLLFRSLWRSVFMRTIFFISFCDTIANCTVFFGSPGDGVMCSVQGLVQQFFYPASWFWTCMLSFLIYSLVTHGKIAMSQLQMHLICWTIPLFLTLLPLTTSDYGQAPEDDDFCWIQPRGGGRSENMAIFWQILTFDAVIFGTGMLMFYWGVLVYLKVRANTGTTPAVRNAMNMLFLYPVIIMVCWIPNALQTNIDPDRAANSTTVVSINCISIMQGALTACVFFGNSREARNNWVRLLGMHHLSKGINRGIESAAGSVGSEDSRDRDSVASTYLAEQEYQDFDDDETYWASVDVGESGAGSDLTTSTHNTLITAIPTIPNNPLHDPMACDVEMPDGL